MGQGRSDSHPANRRPPPATCCRRFRYRHFSSLRRNVTSPALGSPWTATQKPATAWPMTPRKASTALLAHQGLRPTTTGGHLAVVEIMRAQFPGVPGLTSLDRLRRRRNQAEYPDPTGYDPIAAEEASEAIQVAVACLHRERGAPTRARATRGVLRLTVQLSKYFDCSQRLRRPPRSRWSRRCPDARRSGSSARPGITRRRPRSRSTAGSRP
jgi:hypothetical protein